MHVVESSVATLTREVMGTLSAGERKVARALLGTYPVAGLETAAALAQRAGVSAPTVVRFVARLGFSGYPTFQKALMREVHARMGSPLEQYGRRVVAPGEESPLPDLSRTLTSGVEATFAELPPSEFDSASQLLATPSLRVHVMGGRFSHVLADYLAPHLQLLRPAVGIVPNDGFARGALASDATDDDLLVAFDYRRYDPATVRLAKAVAGNGARVILFTDPWLSPIADFAHVVLPSRVESPSPFDSLTAGFALVEALIARVTERLAEAGRVRVEQAERIRAELDPQAPSP